MDKIEVIQNALDIELIRSKKHFLTLGASNKLLLKKGLISISEKNEGYLKSLLEKDLINGIQTQEKPRQWRIYESGKKVNITSSSKNKSVNTIKDQIHRKNSGGSDFIKIRKSHLIWGLVILLVLFYFGNNSYQNLNKLNSKIEIPIEASDRKLREYSPPQTLKSDSLNLAPSKKVKPKINPTPVEENKKKEKVNNQKNITYKSSYYDRERNGRILNTNQEVTFHTFNFSNNTVTQRSRYNGEWIEIKYPFTSSYEEKGMLSTTYVLKVGTLGVKEIWWSPEVPNLGYDYDDGTRLSCYDLQLVRQ